MKAQTLQYMLMGKNEKKRNTRLMNFLKHDYKKSNTIFLLSSKTYKTNRNFKSFCEKNNITPHIVREFYHQDKPVYCVLKISEEDIFVN
jgi:general stress protein 26